MNLFELNEKGVAVSFEVHQSSITLLNSAGNKVYCFFGFDHFALASITRPREWSYLIHYESIPTLTVAPALGCWR